jgi:hypothetical protein
MNTLLKVLAGVTLVALFGLPVTGVLATSLCGTSDAQCTTFKAATTAEPGCDAECRITPKLAAATDGTTGTTGGSDTVGGVTTVSPPAVDETAMMNIVKKIVDWIFTFLMLFVVIMVLVAGFMFVTGGGNPDNVTKARNMLMYALIGFAIGMLSKGVLALVAVFLGQKVPTGGFLS